MDCCQLKEFRFFREKTQDQLFIETGIPQSKISRIENGYIKPNEKEKRLLAKALGTTPDEIFSIKKN